MRSALVLCFCVATWAFADVRVSLETVAPRERYFVGEPIRIILRVRFDHEFFESNAVQLFQRELDLPVQVGAAWLDPPASADGPTIALNDSVVRVRSDEVGVFVIERTFLAREPGDLILAAPRLRYGYATRFKEDFIQGRIPADRHDVTVEGDPLTLAILPLPEQGRPAGFGGAVGRALTVRAEARPRILAAGAIVKLTLTIQGEGNLEAFEAPRLDDLTGFHVYGAVEERKPARRVTTYDLAPLRGEVTAVPAIAFVYFDSEAVEYRTLRTEPIPLSVRGEEVSEPRQAEDRSDAWMLPWLGAAALLGVVVWNRRRRGRTPRVDPAAEFHARADVSDAFVDYLAARLDCPAAAVISPELAERLVRAGVPADLTGQTAALVEELVAARYGGAVTGDRAMRARATVDALEAGGFPG